MLRVPMWKKGALFASADRLVSKAFLRFAASGSKIRIRFLPDFVE